MADEVFFPVHHFDVDVEVADVGLPDGGADFRPDAGMKLPVFRLFFRAEPDDGAVVTRGRRRGSEGICPDQESEMIEAKRLTAG